MESKKIKDILKQFEKKETYKKIFINGSWGIGKSYYTEEYQKENPSSIIYVSLFGKNSYEAIEDAIAIELMNKLSKLEKLPRKLSELAKKISGTFSYKGISISSPSIQKKNLFKNYSKLLEEKKLIIVIDDIERKSGNIQIEDVMGLIEQFSLYDNIKILVIGSEENMNKTDKEKWLNFKEKIIEKEYNITSFSENAIESIVIGKLNKYIYPKELKTFIVSFLEKHKTNNLRSIEKGVNLFLEVIGNYLKKEYDSNIYLSILKNCMSVAIEFSEELYKPKELPEKKGTDFINSLTQSIDEDMYSRILSHYLHDVLIKSKESSILEYIISFYKGEIGESVIEDFNNIVENYLNVEEEKNLFYLSEEQITLILAKRYNLIKNDEYPYSTIEQLIDDFYELLSWNESLKLDLDIPLISEKFNKILFDNYYSIEKEEQQNMIDDYNIRRYDSKELNNLIREYNEKCSEKFKKEKLKNIIDEYKLKTFNVDKLEWLNWCMLQENRNKIIKYIMSEFETNNFLIPDLSIEISENEWRWTHNIWKIYYERFSEKDKKKINKAAEKMKINVIATTRINSLQNYRPLFIENDKKKSEL